MKKSYASHYIPIFSSKCLPNVYTITKSEYYILLCKVSTNLYILQRSQRVDNVTKTVFWGACKNIKIRICLTKKEKIKASFYHEMANPSAYEVDKATLVIKFVQLTSEMVEQIVSLDSATMFNKIFPNGWGQYLFVVCHLRSKSMSAVSQSSFQSSSC